MNTNPRYQLDGDTMYVYHDSGQVDIMVKYLGNVWTLTATGVSKYMVEKGDDL